jgi:asparagine synthase (glutamine-hydrolysing)
VPTSGLVALCNLAGNALSAKALAALGLPDSAGSFSGVVADLSVPSLADAEHSETRVTLLLGWTSSSRLGIASVLGPGRALAMRRLLDQHGSQLAELIDGEWILLDWQPGRLTLVQSRARRDRLYIARRGDLVALCGDIERMAALDWVGRALDPLGFAGALGRSSLRTATARQTILPGVERLEPGEHRFFERSGERSSRADLPPVQPWQGTFSEAVEAAREALDLILRERVAVSGRFALMLSGGLDSSTLAALIAGIAGSGSNLLALTSVAPAGSGLADERGEAAAVADWLGLKQVLVVPDPDSSVYLPDAEAFRNAGGPTLSPRHYLYSALFRLAAASGVSTLFDGAYGELSLTSYMPLNSPWFRVRQALKRIRGRWASGHPGSRFHVRLAPHRAALLAGQVEELSRQHEPQPAQRDLRDAWGWMPGYDKAWAVTTQLYHGVRSDTPFRDPRLLALFAGFPARFLVQGGLDRAAARAMMAARLPESIRLRRSHGAFSPDYMQRIRDQAAPALVRLPLFRKAGADEWLDLDWLEQTLRRIDSEGPGSIEAAFEAQLTTMTAEFLVWWHR